MGNPVEDGIAQGSPEHVVIQRGLVIGKADEAGLAVAFVAEETQSQRVDGWANEQDEKRYQEWRNKQVWCQSISQRTLRCLACASAPMADRVSVSFLAINAVSPARNAVYL